MLNKPTKRETERALNKSIRHWDRHAKGKAKEGEGVYSSDCALCSLFLTDRDTRCQGCPVYKRTGIPTCHGTPWSRAEQQFVGSQPSSEESDEFRKAAAEMRDFLISLKEDVQ